MDVFVIHCQISHYWWPGNPRTRTARAMRLSRIIPSWVLEIVICDGKNVFCRTVVRFLCPRMNNCLRVLISVLMSVMQYREKKSHFFDQLLVIHMAHAKACIAWLSEHDGVIKWKHFPRYWPFVRGIHRSGYWANIWIASYYDIIIRFNYCRIECPNYWTVTFAMCLIKESQCYLVIFISNDSILIK